MRTTVTTLVTFLVCSVMSSTAITLTVPYHRLAPLMKRPRAPSYPLLLEEDLPQLAPSLEAQEEAAEWETVDDPRFIVFSDADSNFQGKRVKRNGPSLSIVNPLEVLRQRLLLELARRKMRVSENQIQANAKILNSVGKRDASAQETNSRTSDEAARSEATYYPLGSSSHRWMGDVFNDFASQLHSAQKEDSF